MRKLKNKALPLKNWPEKKINKELARKGHVEEMTRAETLDLGEEFSDNPYWIFLKQETKARCVKPPVSR